MTKTESAEPCKIVHLHGRDIYVPESFHETFGDLVRRDWRGTPNGQVVEVSQSMLQEHSLSRVSRLESFPTAALLYVMTSCFPDAQRPDKLEVPYRVICALESGMMRHQCRNPSIADFVATSPEGIIAAGGGVTAAEIIADICLAFPLHRVLVISPLMSESIRLFKSVRPFAPFVSTLLAHSSSPPDLDGDPDEYEERKKYQLVFAPLPDCANLGDLAGLDLARFSIVVYTHGQRANDLMNSVLVCASNPRYRLFGLVHLDRYLSHDESCHIVQVFGSRRLEIPSSGRCRSRVFCFPLRNEMTIRNLARGEQSHQKVMRCLETCTNRNSQIAKLAQELDSGRLTPGRDNSIRDWLEVTGPCRPRSVAVICRTFLHAARLAAGLEGWRIYYPLDSMNDSLSGLRAADKDRIRQLLDSAPVATRVICPLDFLGSYLAQSDPEILVYAAAGRFAPDLKKWLTHPDGSDRVRLIIDIEDRRNKWTRRDSKSRRREFMAQSLLPEKAITGGPMAQQFAWGYYMLDDRLEPVRRRRSEK